MSTAVSLRLIVLLLCVVLRLSPITGHQQTRRILHQPFFPQDSFPPSQPPSFSPQPQQQQQQQQPKLPFSSSSQSPPQPFFPFYHTPPPPPPATILATFPANISSLLLPQPTSHPHSHILAIAVSASLLSAALFAALTAFLLYRKNRAVRLGGKISRTDSLSLYPPNIATSDGGFKQRRTLNTSSEFLYLGTLVNSRGIYEENVETGCGGGIPVGVSATPRRNLGSPELKPLPPLARHHSLQDKYGYDELGSVTNELEDDAEEFFSPRGSSGGKENLSRTGSSSRKMFHNVEAVKHGTRSVNLKTSSYPSSYSDSPILSASNSPSLPLIMSPSSLNSKSPDSVIIFPAPLRPLPARPITYTSPYSSSSSSPSHKDSRSTKNSPSRKTDSAVPETPLQTADKAAVEPSLAPPPPPPPPPPRKLWEIPAPASLTKEPNLRPPVLLTPSRPAGFQNFAPICSSDQLSGNTVAEGNDGTPKPKLKPLHWDKVRASSDRAMVWDQIKSSSFQLNEEMIETLFTANNPNSTQKDNVRRSVIPSPNHENWVLDSKKSQNIAILLRALNVTTDEVCEALLEGNADSLGAELLESLLKMAPTKEEEIKLTEFKDESPFKLGSAEKFLKAVLDIPFAFRRIDAMLYIANFDSEIEYLKRSFDTLEAACEELKTSRMFLKLLEAVLKTGNRMNVGTNRGDAHAFKLDTLLKLVDIKGTDGKTTLLHFVVQEIIKAEGFRLSGSNQRATIDNDQPSSLTDDVRLKKLGLQVVSGLSRELSNVKKAAAMDSKTLRNEASKLVGGIEKIEDMVKLIEEIALKTNSWKFSMSMKEFMCKAEEEIIRTQAQESVALFMVKEVTEYFHGNSAIEEAHPFRIFTVVRDFLSILDQVCKEVGKINERAIVGSTRLFPVPVNPTVAPAFPGRQHSGSSEDESSSMSSP